MKFTLDWLKDHLDTKKTEKQIAETLNNIGLEVESIEPIKNELSNFVVARVIKAQKHPNADRLKVCDVDIGNNKILKVVCGAPNAIDGLLTIYAPPGSIIPKNNIKLEVSKIRGITSYGMLCSEAELGLSEESQGIISLDSKYNNKLGKSFFNSKIEMQKYTKTTNRKKEIFLSRLHSYIVHTPLTANIQNSMFEIYSI